MKCRHCAAALDRVCLDLGSAPPSNAYLTEATLRAPELWYPLRLLVCERCWLVQTEDHAGREALFGDDYAYFESAHGTAPDIAGRNIINPTATLLSGAMLLDYLGLTDAATRLRAAMAQVYAAGKALTPDQGGTATTTEFCADVQTGL